MSASLWAEAARHRTGLDQVKFVAVTGSCGKTTTIRLTDHLLKGSMPGVASADDANCGDGLAATILSVSSTDRYCVQELGAWGPSTLEAGLSLVQPELGVITNVRRDHRSAFRTLEATQREKRSVVACLPSHGVAVLNADDPLVAGMAEHTSARVVTFGRGEDADVRATRVSARWPDRLAFDLTLRGRTLQVATRLVGEHGLGSVLAAVAIADDLGVPASQITQRLASAEAVPRRMSAMVVPDGITFIRDDFKAPSDSMGEVIAFLREARAPRKFAVVGQISDHPGRSRHQYLEVVKMATDVVDELVLVGERPYELEQRRSLLERPTTARVSIFETVETASRWLESVLRAGDLVLLKGSGPADHLERVLLSRTSRVTCWSRRCGRAHSCDGCALLSAEHH